MNDIEREGRREGETEPPPPETVTVEALQDHTCQGESYETGDVYEIPVELVDTIVAQGKAKVVVEDEETRETRRRDRPA